MQADTGTAHSVTSSTHAIAASAWAVTGTVHTATGTEWATIGSVRAVTGATLDTAGSDWEAPHRQLQSLRGILQPLCGLSQATHKLLQALSRML